MLRFLYIIASGLVFLSGCSKSDSGQSSPRGFTEPKPETRASTYTNSMLVTRMEDRFFWDACDERLHPIRKEVAQAIDIKLPWIKENFASRSTTVSNVPDDDEMMVGEFIFLKAMPPEMGSDWKNQRHGWEDLQKSYANAKTALDWARVVSQFNLLVDKDLKRLYYEMNFGLDLRSEDSVLALFENLLKCTVELESCLSAESQKTLEGIPNYKKMWEFALSDEQYAGRLKKFKFLVNEVRSSWSRQFGFRRNPLVRREGNNFILPLRTEDYKGVKAELKTIIESYWTYEGQRVIVEWTDDLRAYEIIMPEQYINPVTDTQSKKVYIYPGAPIEAFPHEIGHALGLPDDYFVIWDQSDCRYRQEAQKGNLMSLAEGGHARKKHFDKLNRYYPQ
jgi:hypothetical protein